jgi:uncharacterized membrane protein
MSDVIKVIRKGGMRNREINESIKDIMAVITKNREEKKQKDEAERLAKSSKLSESVQIISDATQAPEKVVDENPEAKNE